VEAFYQQLLERVNNVPGVSGATLSVVAPITGGGQRRVIEIEGYQPQSTEDMELNTNVVGPDFFRTMDIPIVRGRDFGPSDRQGSPGVAIVNEELARRYFNGDALGKRLQVESDKGYLEIVGVARTAKYRNLREAPLPFIYLPLAQDYQPDMTVIVRTQGEPGLLLGTLRNEMPEVDKAVPVFSVQLLRETIADQLAADRMFAVLLSAFGAVALLLAAIGIYGVMGYAVAQRTREIGVRMALGASRRTVVGMVLTRAGILVAIGLVVGGAGAWYLSSTAKTFLFRMDTTDWRVFATAIGVLTAAALLASAIPARRAAGVNPIVALRSE
jgi:putative ABC transport system permease protein